MLQVLRFAVVIQASEHHGRSARDVSCVIGACLRPEVNARLPLNAIIVVRGALILVCAIQEVLHLLTQHRILRLGLGSWLGHDHMHNRCLLDLSHRLA